jgi:hypothetical protein
MQYLLSTPGFRLIDPDEWQIGGRSTQDEVRKRRELAAQHNTAAMRFSIENGRLLPLRVLEPLW